MARELTELLVEESGIPIDTQAGGKAPDTVVDREVNKEPCPRAKKLRDLYFQTLSSATNEFPYWYTRRVRRTRRRDSGGPSRRSAQGSVLASDSRQSCRANCW